LYCATQFHPELPHAATINSELNQKSRQRWVHYESHKDNPAPLVDSFKEMVKAEDRKIEILGVYTLPDEHKAPSGGH
jgi:hypothetical protein